MKKTTIQAMSEVAQKLGQELAADIVKETKERGEKLSPEMRKQFNKARIKALGLTLIQGGKSDKESV
jgi:DhnA family fructose-bisphosphate aldolase class Ia